MSHQVTIYRKTSNSWLLNYMKLAIRVLPQPWVPSAHPYLARSTDAYCLVVSRAWKIEESATIQLWLLWWSNLIAMIYDHQICFFKNETTKPVFDGSPVARISVFPMCNPTQSVNPTQITGDIPCTSNRLITIPHNTHLPTGMQLPSIFLRF